MGMFNQDENGCSLSASFYCEGCHPFAVCMLIVFLQQWDLQWVFFVHYFSFWTKTELNEDEASVLVLDQHGSHFGEKKN